MKIPFFLMFYCLLYVNSLRAQVSPAEPNDSLYATIMKMDSLLFQVAFNQCNLEVYESIITDDIEFYDDRSGLNTSLQVEINAFKDKCSKPFSITRKLINSEVDKLGSFGAVQLGEHAFYMDGKKVEQASFVTIWEKKGPSWIVKRAISYRHQSVEE